MKTQTKRDARRPVKRLVKRPPARPTGRRYNSVAELCLGEGLPLSVCRLLEKYDQEHPDPDSKNFTPLNEEGQARRDNQ